MPQRDEVRLFDVIADIPATAWDALHDGQPSLRHAYLDTLERTGCVGPGTGWLPRHATLWRDGMLIAAMPLYEKHHSYGEYVFDWAWADAYARHGLAYYPKWLAAVPFTPVPGARLLAVDDHARATLLHAVLELAQASGGSSFHLLLPTSTEAAGLRAAGLLMRQGVQFHWRNHGYADFGAFLASLNHDKRKKIRQERSRGAAHGLAVGNDRQGFEHRRGEPGLPLIELGPLDGRGKRRPGENLETAAELGDFDSVPVVIVMLAELVDRGPHFVVRGIGIELRRPEGDAIIVRKHDRTAVLSGHPSELVLYLGGRRAAADVALDGDPAAVDAVSRADLSI